jgi:hypothetical protein
MKREIMYHGKSYEVPSWVNYIAIDSKKWTSNVLKKDGNCIVAYEEKPIWVKNLHGNHWTRKESTNALTLDYTNLKVKAKDSLLKVSEPFGTHGLSYIVDEIKPLNIFTGNNYSNYQQIMVECAEYMAKRTNPQPHISSYEIDKLIEKHLQNVYMVDDIADIYRDPLYSVFHQIYTNDLIVLFNITNGLSPRNSVNLVNEIVPLLKDKYAFIETFSTDFVNQIRFKIYENELDNNDVIFYFKESSTTKLTPVAIDMNGHFLDSGTKNLINYPTGFFDASLKQLLQIC